VYVGNVAEIKGQNTVCPKCQAVLIRRMGYHVLSNNITNGTCPKCGHAVYGKWST
jgi:pyruvate formate lyase activating enzyme